MLHYVDNRDDQSLILTHVYLIQGVSFGIFYASFTPYPIQSIQFIGVIVLGVGDSFAAIVGSKFGRVKLFKTNKSLEGMIAFVVSTYLSGVII